MLIKDIMTKDVACCTPETNLQNVAQMMVDHHCGAIPVVENEESMRPVGMVTDRDICCRVVARGLNPLELSAADCMTPHCISVDCEKDVSEGCNLMEFNQVRRLVVTDHASGCCGIVAQADVAEHLPEDQTGRVVREVSHKSVTASSAGD